MRVQLQRRAKPSRSWDPLYSLGRSTPTSPDATGLAHGHGAPAREQKVAERAKCGPDYNLRCLLSSVIVIHIEVNHRVEQRRAATINTVPSFVTLRRATPSRGASEQIDARSTKSATPCLAHLRGKPPGCWARARRGGRPRAGPRHGRQAGPDRDRPSF